MFGLVSTAVLRRQVRVGQNADGSPTFTQSTPWAGRTIRCFVQTKKGETRYERAGAETREEVTIFLPRLTGADVPLSQDVITVTDRSGSSDYLVEFTSSDGRNHHLEVKVIIIRRAP